MKKGLFFLVALCAYLLYTPVPEGITEPLRYRTLVAGTKLIDLVVSITCIVDLCNHWLINEFVFLRGFICCTVISLWIVFICDTGGNIFSNGGDGVGVGVWVDVGMDVAGVRWLIPTLCKYAGLRHDFVIPIARAQSCVLLSYFGWSNQINWSDWRPTHVWDCNILHSDIASYRYYTGEIDYEFILYRIDTICIFNRYHDTLIKCLFA